ncbi:MAG: ABC transporter substrate-binding protein [Deltaproteobacteria bacterium]|nr:ABC transporter substrate-binding protein [Deltaproteobacteria bacterium]MBI3079511.1 ABC transporter substrate-binding protein [Deltaproteobacteria bacterium]
MDWRRSWAIVGILLAAALWLPGAATAQQPIKIGAILPLTGGFAYSGLSQMNAMKIAQEEINAKGGVLGRKIMLLVEDGACNPAQSVNAAEKLITRDKVVALLGAFCSSATGAVMEIARRYEIPLITGVSTSPLLTEQGNKWFFRAQATSRLMARAVMDYMVKQHKIKTLAFLCSNNDWGRGVVKEYGDAIRGFGGRVLAEEYYAEPDTDFYSYLTKIKALNPDAIAMAADEQHGAGIMKQIREVGIRAKLFGEGPWTTDAYLRIAGAASHGFMAVIEYIHLVEHPANKAFLAKYMERHKENPTKYSAAGHTILNILVDGIRRAKSTDAGKLRDALEKTDYSGFTGTFRFDAKHQAYNFDIFIAEIRDGKPLVVGKTKIGKPS